MRYTVDLYATFLVTVEVEADSADDAIDKVWSEDLNAAAKRKIADNNGLPEIEFEVADAYQQL